MYSGHYVQKLEQTRDGGLITSDHRRGRSAESFHNTNTHHTEEIDVARVAGGERANSVVTLNRRDGRR